MNNRMSALYSGLGSFVQPRRMQEGGQALTDLQRNVLAEQGLTPAEAQGAVRMIIAGQGNMLSPKFKELSGTGYWRRVGQAFNMVDASGAPITLGGSTAVAGGRTYTPAGEQYLQMLENKAAAEQNYTYGSAPPASTSPPADAPPAETAPPAEYQRFNVMNAFAAGADPINFSGSFESNFGARPVNPGQDSPNYGFYQIDVANWDLAQNTWNSMNPEQRAGITDFNGTPVNNFVLGFTQQSTQRVPSGAAQQDPGNPVGNPASGTTQGSNTLPTAGTVVGDLFPERVLPTMDMVRQQSLEGPMLSGNFLDTRQNPQVYQLPTQGYESQRQDPFGINVKQTTRPLNIPERIIPAAPQPQPAPGTDGNEVGTDDPRPDAGGGVTN